MFLFFQGVGFNLSGVVWDWWFNDVDRNYNDVDIMLLDDEAR